MSLSAALLMADRSVSTTSSDVPGGSPPRASQSAGWAWIMCLLAASKGCGMVVIFQLPDTSKIHRKLFIKHGRVAVVKFNCHLFRHVEQRRRTVDFKPLPIDIQQMFGGLA